MNFPTSSSPFSTIKYQISMAFSSFLSPTSLIHFPTKPHKKHHTTKPPFTNSFFLNPLKTPTLQCTKSATFEPKETNPSSCNHQTTPNCTKEPNFIKDNDESFDFSAFAKPVVYSLFLIVIGVCPVIGFFDKPKVANAVGVMEVLRGGRKGRGGRGGGEEVRKKGHLYSGYTDRLLEKVSELIRVIQEVREGGKDVELVEGKLKEVKTRKNELQDGIMEGLHSELRALRGERGKLVVRSEELEQLAEKLTREEEAYAAKAETKRKGKGTVTGEVSEEVNGKMSQLEKSMRDAEVEYTEIWQRIDEIEDLVTRKETMALSIGVRELAFIERECEQLVKRFIREMNQKTMRQGLDFLFSPFSLVSN